MLFALAAPVLWTTKVFYCRLAEGRYGFNLLDVAIDSQIYMNLIATVLYVAYLQQNEFKIWEFLAGSIVAVFFILGYVFSTVAYRHGPGGPINALVGTQVVYHTIINALFFDQALSLFQIVGILTGVLSTVIISVGDEILSLWRPLQFAETDIEQKSSGFSSHGSSASLALLATK